MTRTATYKRVILLLRLIGIVCLTLLLCCKSTESSSEDLETLSVKQTNTDAVCDSPVDDSTSITTKYPSAADFLTKHNSHNEAKIYKFKIQGWRWHTLAVITETTLFRNLVVGERCTIDSIAAATDYLVHFQWSGLRSVETEVFFPWLRRKLQSLPDENIASDFLGVLDHVESIQTTVTQRLDGLVTLLESFDSSPTKIELVVKLLDECLLDLNRIFDLEDRYLVPMIRSLVSEMEQSILNTRILQKLGLFKSRTYLVSMHLAILDTDDAMERELFQQEIPLVARYMIPRWKRLLYDPKAGMLRGD